MSTKPLGHIAAAAAIASIEWRCLLRRRSLWVAGFIAILPALIPLVQRARHAWLDSIGATIAALSVCAPLIVASMVADDLVDKTASYLFTRPIARPAVFLGKAVAGIPPLILLMSIPVTLSFFACNNDPGQLLGEYANALLGVSLGAVATGFVAAAWGAIFPRRALAAAIGYLFLFDTLLAAIPFSVNNIAMTRHAIRIAEGDGIIGPACWLACLSGAWVAVGLWRFQKRSV